MSFIPNTTPTPNWLYNGEMKKMSDTELRVVLVVTRHTLGWIENKESGMRKQEDWVSHSKLIEKTGRGSGAISRAVDVCVKNGWIETRDKDGNLLKTANERRRRRVFYRLGNMFTDKLKSTTISEVDENLPPFEKKSTIILESNLPPKGWNTKETLTKETLTKELAETSSASFSLEEKLGKMEQEENSYLDIIATFIREKPVLIENSKQLSAVISRYCRVAKKLAGAYTNKQIFATAEKIKNGDLKVDWTLETVYKQLTK